MPNHVEYLNEPVDARKNFVSNQNNYFFLEKLINFDIEFKYGTILCTRYRRKLRLSFNQEMQPFEKTNAWEFPPDYGQDKIIGFYLNFISPFAFRIQFNASRYDITAVHTVPLIVENPEKISSGDSFGWILEKASNDMILYRNVESEALCISRDPFIIYLLDRDNRVIWKSISISEKISLMNSDPLSCCFVQNIGTEDRSFAFSYGIHEDEKFFGCGESFTRLNKRGQKVILYSTDPKGVSFNQMYKPVPFFISNKGYGMFLHTSCPCTFDFGASYDGATTIYVNEEIFDLLVFLGMPQRILSQYTSFTGRSPVPPDWSFGLWMGRISYSSQIEVLDIAKKIEEKDIPCDVIHLDTGWFNHDWRCDYKFDLKRFSDLSGMFDQLKKQGFHLSLWQLPYITPKNELFRELLSNGMAIKGNNHDLPTDDAILDFSNPKAVSWYKDKLKDLLDKGVSVIKADFGEAAPYHGIYDSGYSGKYEHNLYPLRYNKAVGEITKDSKGYTLIWARSAWAGSQRYPVHWGGDAENSNCAMAASLRGGLSLGLCGFTYWSHDIGGFVKSPPPDLYLRWLAFGMFTSHARCHGNPPREPWEFSEEFQSEFRRLVEIRYKLMPYILAQAYLSSKMGFGMIRPLFFEYPLDETCYNIEDEYFFGSDFLIAPIFEDNENKRQVYVPFGNDWVDYFTEKPYEGGKWHEISTDSYIVVLARSGSLIPEFKIIKNHVVPYDGKKDCIYHAFRVTETIPCKGYVMLDGHCTEIYSN